MSMLTAGSTGQSTVDVPEVFDLRQYVVPQDDGVNQLVVSLVPEAGFPGCVREFDDWELQAVLDGRLLPVVATPDIRWIWSVDEALTGAEIDRLELTALPLEVGVGAG